MSASPTVPTVTGSGLDRDVWAERVAAAPARTLAGLRAEAPGRDRLLVFSAHPDDESIGAGRLLSAWRRAGGTARAVLATAGEACVDHVGPRPAGLAERRLREWRAALAVLDVEPGETYGLPDSGLDAAAAALEVAVRRTLATAGPPDGLVLLAPHPDDPHPDHRAVGRVVARAGADLGVPVWAYPVWMTYWADPAADLGGELVHVRADATDDAAWRDAVACFPSQLEPLAPGWGAVVPPAMLAHHDAQLLVLPAGGRA